MAVIGDVLVKLVADFAEFTKGFDEATKKLDQFNKSTTKIGDELQSITNFIKGGLGFGAALEIFNQVKKAADDVSASVLKIADAASNVGLSSTEFQGLQRAAKDVGLSADAASNAYTRFDQRVKAGQAGQKDAIDAFEKLAIKLLDSQGKIRSTTDLFEEFSSKVMRLSDDQRRAVEQGFLGITGSNVDEFRAARRRAFSRWASRPARRAGSSKSVRSRSSRSCATAARKPSQMGRLLGRPRRHPGNANPGAQGCHRRRAAGHRQGDRGLRHPGGKIKAAFEAAKATEPSMQAQAPPKGRLWK